MKIAILILAPVVVAVSYAVIFHPGLLTELFWKWWHRKSCGRQEFVPLRREILSSSRFLTLHGKLLDVAEWDVRAQCPKCGRTHRFQIRTAYELTNYQPDDE